MQTLLYQTKSYRKFSNTNGNYYFHFYGEDGEVYASSPAYTSISELDNSIVYLVEQNPRKDDLKVVEGIGPKIEGLLNDAGIITWSALSRTETSVLKEILDDAGPRYRMHDPSTWARQSGMANEGKWDDLKAWQDELDGGRS